ncbi:alpha-L-fucosidase [Flavihumibacter profundi]|uniref:alpha-L-fucosidase n=1 Tax=Flavihumibacter profundi TaxID=2716883 RepID=UPI001CC625E7|nr:alpha-L-fucosidase [Flavihumibacter profundi]MBZ5857509.1 alpha-L-fucosidase [Flavihumibacter profundi]
MKTRLITLYLAVALSGISLTSKAQTGYTPTPENLAARQAFQSDRFGMFIHWGASSVLGAGEWVMNDKNIKVQDYARLQQIFNPEQFDAEKWVSTAKRAGMKYITFITRHHDGFSNWDTKYSDWKITNTPYGKDVLKALSAECQRQGIKLYLYYSLLDWYRTDYQYWTGRTGQGTGRTNRGNWEDYIAFMKNQLTELLTNYGPIAGVWFDGHWDQVAYNETTKKWEGDSRVNWHYDEIYGLIHRLQPQALIGNNHHLLPIDGEDFQMFERDLPGQNTTGWGTDVKSISSLPLETCETINKSWGFNITDDAYKSAAEIVHLLVKGAGLNANLLLNIGPMPNGVVQPEFQSRLDSVGAWMAVNGESIYGTQGVGLTKASWGTATRKGNTIYLHILSSPGESLVINDLPFKKIKSITVLKNGKQLTGFSLKNKTLTIPQVSQVEKDPFDTVLKLDIQP